jgi:hypothetical protein
VSGVAGVKPQLPIEDQVFLDHSGWFVPDMAEASRALERLGFLLTPYSLHGDRDPVTGVLRPVGTANRLIMLEQGYLEILATAGDIDSPVARHMRTTLAERGPGVHLIAFAVADAARKAAALTASGFGLQPTVNLRRTLEAENGTQAEVAFTVVRPAFVHFPECRMQALTHHKPEHMWQRRYVAQQNGIVGLESVSLLVPDVADTTERMARVIGKDGTLKLDRGSIGVTGTLGHPRIESLGLISRDLALTARVLAERGVAVRRDGDALIVAPADALGVQLEICGT